MKKEVEKKMRDDAEGRNFGIGMKKLRTRRRENMKKEKL